MTDEPMDRPWWEFDPTEVPVPLVGAERAGGFGIDAHHEIADEAEFVVQSAREALARQDTESVIYSLKGSGDGPSGSAPTFAGKYELSLPTLGRPALLLALALLAAGCVAMFALGWSQGTAASELAREPGASIGSSGQLCPGKPDATEARKEARGRTFTERLTDHREGRSRNEEVRKR